MRKLNKSILLISNRKPYNKIDESLEIFTNNSIEFHYLYNGPPLDQPWASKYSRRWCRKNRNKWDVVYFRADWFDSFLAKGEIFKALELLDPKKIVFGYHCHLCSDYEYEKKMFQMASSFVLLNEEAKTYFIQKYPSTAHNPVFLLRSLFLPKREWYGSYPKEIKRSRDILICVPGNTNRFSTLPGKSHPLVPDINSAMNRYDYLRMARIIGRQSGINLFFFGTFETYNGKLENRVRNLYQECGLNISMLGKVSNQYFSEELRPYHFGLLNGYLPHEVVPDFEHMNYQLRYNTILKANVQPLISINSASWHENETRRTSFGFVIEDNSILANLREYISAYKPDEELWLNAIYENSLDKYITSLIDFLLL